LPVPHGALARKVEPAQERRHGDVLALARRHFPRRTEHRFCVFSGVLASCTEV
jgi:hypothetical protein